MNIVTSTLLFNEYNIYDLLSFVTFLGHLILLLQKVLYQWLLIFLRATLIVVLATLNNK